MSTPVSREKGQWPNDRVRFWPIKGGSNIRPGGNCLSLPKGQVTTLQPGKFTIKFEIGEKAAHVVNSQTRRLDFSKFDKGTLQGVSH